MVDKPRKKKRETKEYVEQFLDKMLKEDIVSRVAWVMNAVPLSDLRDVAVGYVIGITFGYLERYGLINEILDGSKLDSEDYRNTMAVFKKTLPKIVEKVEKEYCE
jgi:hypothetical protein